MQSDAAGGEVALDLVGELVGVEKEVKAGIGRGRQEPAGIGQDHGVGHEDGIAMYVGAAQIGEPGYFVERRHHHGIGAGLAQGRAQAGHLGLHFFAGIFDGLHLDGPQGQGRTVGPEGGEGVFVDAEAHAAHG